MNTQEAKKVGEISAEVERLKKFQEGLNNNGSVSISYLRGEIDMVSWREVISIQDEVVVGMIKDAINTRISQLTTQLLQY